MDLTITATERFPIGVTVGAYPASAWGQYRIPPKGAPPAVSPTATATMTATGATLRGLSAGVRYFIGADVTGGGAWVWIMTSTLADPTTAGLDTSAPGFVVHGSDPNVTRPNHPVVFWRGSVQPNNMTSDDVWIVTA